MTLAEQVFAQAQLLTGELEDRQNSLLELLCQSAVSALSARLRAGLTPEDCRADFLAAASLYAVAALAEAQEDTQPERVQLGDITVARQGGGAAARCLRNQAALILAPYLKDAFAFSGV